MPERVALLRGAVSEMALSEVLQVVGLSRQFVAVELTDARGHVCGAIFLKAGTVVTVAPSQPDARAAFVRLLQPGAVAEFQVFRLQDPATFPPAVGPLGRLLFEAASRESVQAPAPTDRPRLRAMPTVRMPQPPGTRSARRTGPTAPRPPLARAASADAPVASPPPLPSSPSSPLPPPLPTRTTGTQATTPVPPPARPERHAPSGTQRAKPALIVAVASPKGGVGKTTLAVNVAVALAQRGHRTILVDADPNGDVASALDAQARLTRGLYDVLAGAVPIDRVVRRTAIEGLRIVPARGRETPLAALDPPESRAAMYHATLRGLSRSADVVLVDCPAGMFGTTRAVLNAATHALGVFQAETIASRSFDIFGRALDALDPAARPALLGVVANMFNPRSDASVAAVRDLMAHSADYRPFETTIPRSDGFVSAHVSGQPLRAADAGTPDTLACLFDMLAAEVWARLVPASVGAATTARSFLL